MSARYPVPNSTIAAAPSTAAPPGACDAHMHIYDARFGDPGSVFPDSTVDDYRALQALTGTQRTVVVQPRGSGTDNRAILDAIQRLGPENTRGIAVVDAGISDAELQAMDAAGIRGLRFTLFRPKLISAYVPEQSPVSFDMVETLAHRVHELGWHVQLHWNADQVEAHRELLDRLPTPIVFDHFARVPVDEGIRNPAYAIVQRLLQEGRAWLKLSGAYLDSKLGTAGAYRDMDDIAQAWIKTAPDRLLWGSDWPHPSADDPKPDDALLFDMLARWNGDEGLRRRILVDNPAALYGFGVPAATGRS